MTKFRITYWYFAGIICSVMLLSCSEKESDEASVEGMNEPLIVETDEPGMDADLTISNTIPTDGMEDGYYKKNYPNEVLQVEGLVVNGKRSGLWTSYHPAGNKQSENNYVNGELDGKTVVYFPNGQIMYIGYYTNGEPDGQWLYFDDLGTLVKEVVYKNGKVVAEEEKNEKPVE